MKIKTKSNLLVAILTLGTIIGFFTFFIGTTRADSAAIYLDPSGDPTGTTDTFNIQAAFNYASTADSGSIIILGEGIFYLRHAILVGDFDGTFKGQGKGKTIIMNTEDHPFPKIPNYNWPVPCFFWFYLENKGKDPESPANLQIADMTLKVVGYGEYHYWPGWIRADWTIWSVFKIDIYYEECKYNTNFNGIEIIGEYHTNPDGYYVPNLWTGISIWSYGPSTTIKDSHIENCAWPFEFGFEPNSNIKISKNTIVNSLMGIRFFLNDHINVKVSRNTFLNSPGFWSYGDEGGFYLIEHNDITVPIDSLCAGIEVGGFGPFGISLESPRLLISHNKIHSEDSLFWGPIYMEGIHNSIISHNVITGRGPAAMYLGVPVQTTGIPSMGLKLLSNDVENWEVADYTGREWPGTFEGVDPIWLGSPTSNYLVIGRNAGETVTDEGTDNIIIDLP